MWDMIFIYSRLLAVNFSQSDFSFSVLLLHKPRNPAVFLSNPITQRSSSSSVPYSILQSAINLRRIFRSNSHSIQKEPMREMGKKESIREGKGERERFSREES